MNAAPLCPPAVSVKYWGDAVLVALLVLALLLPLARGAVAASPAARQSPRDVVDCSDWRDCRQLALAAADRGAYETFHDLAWRAVQTGPPGDPALMYLVARAQSLSGRPHDALVMLRRLADLGVGSDADTNEDFSRTRQLPGWPELAARIEAIGRPGSPPAIASPGAVSPAMAGAGRPDVLPPVPAATATEEAVRFSAERFTVGGLAYDAVSHRFLFADRLGRKVIVVGEGTTHAVDLVRADSAGFQEISAIAIDRTRGDLWVASAAAGGAGTLHRLQLVSGRPLRSFSVAANPEAVELVDLAVSPAGAVLALDAMSRQLLVLRPGGTSPERVRIEAQEPASVAAGGDEGVAYVAHRDGVSRIDLRARTASSVAAPKEVSLARFERIRWHRNALIAVQVEGDGSRRIMQLALNASGLAITRATRLEASGTAGGQTFVTISGDELVYLAAGSNAAAAGASQGPGLSLVEFVAYRVRLR